MHNDSTTWTTMHLMFSREYSCFGLPFGHQRESLSRATNALADVSLDDDRWFLALRGREGQPEIFARPVVKSYMV